ncbi:MAG: imidazole glycerol phosphate synthase subunit HisH [Chitinophagaceae bacterium]|nr:MAG: imidazole glycerol phosphate synthase subunit HisH [Chitinophagaceae bacterium]
MENTEQNLVIVKYNAGNIQSVLYALERIGVQAVVTDNHDQIRQADKVIFPGVGEASSAMKYLREREMDSLLVSLTQPVLGICLGMQLMCRHSEEGDTACLHIFPNDVRKFNHGLKIPQVGWNTITQLKTDLFTGLPAEPFTYFVHSYYAGLDPHTIAVTDYGIPFSSALHRDNFYGVQFHPEKSAAAGETILRNFINMNRG